MILLLLNPVLLQILLGLLLLCFSALLFMYLDLRKKGEKQLKDSLREEESKDIKQLQNELARQQVEIENYQNLMQELVNDRTAELNHALERAKESDRLKTAFLQSMSHEIRIPMNAIFGFINLLDNPELEPATRDYYHKYIDQSGKVLLHLIDDIIDFSKLETGELSLEPQPCDLVEHISSLVAEYRNKAHRDKPGISILLDKPADSPKVIIDCLRVKQILTNLIDNALKFTDEGSVKIRYSIQGQFIEFIVTDTGIGIENQYLEMIFERFYKISDDKTKMYKGAGLGLAISQRLVELFGGEITAKSIPDQGSEFRFTIPFVPAEQKMGEGADTRNLYHWEDKKVLIAEDEDSNYYFLEAVLSRTGIQITRASNGVELLEIFDNQNDMDIILLDIKMPGLNGYNALKIIRQQNEEVAVIAQTAFNQPSDREKCLALGCNDYLSKPINKEMLLKKMAFYLEK